MNKSGRVSRARSRPHIKAICGSDRAKRNKQAIKRPESLPSWKRLIGVLNTHTHTHGSGVARADGPQRAALIDLMKQELLSIKLSEPLDVLRPYLRLTGQYLTSCRQRDARAAWRAPLAAFGTDVSGEGKAGQIPPAAQENITQGSLFTRVCCLLFN